MDWSKLPALNNGSGFIPTLCCSFPTLPNPTGFLQLDPAIVGARAAGEDKEARVLNTQ